MNWISWIFFGLIAGIIAKMLTPGSKKPQGCLVTIVLGILGAVVGGYIGNHLGFGPVTGFNFRSFGVAVLGAVILLFIYTLIRGK